MSSDYSAYFQCELPGCNQRHRKLSSLGLFHAALAKKYESPKAEIFGDDGKPFRAPCVDRSRLQ